MRILSLLFLFLACAGGASATTPDLVLRGNLTGADHQSYRRVPFVVPAGVQRITVEFDYTGKEERSVIDLGLLGPDGASRGWSGGNKRIFTLSSVDATPSYTPTPIVAGKWALLLGIPNMREYAKAEYTAKVYFSRTLAIADEPEILRQPLKATPAWYRGDLHMHTAHSDGSCPARDGGEPVPCPLFLTTQAAAARGLDFIAISDHNGVAHAEAIRELQPYYNHMLLITGRELTSFYGHANFFGTLAPLDFSVGKGGGQRDWNAVLTAAASLHGLVSINHPVRPSGELCMGCGWDTDTDMRRVQAIEAVNGADADTHYSGVPFWQTQLNRGFRITGVGGSDNHRLNSEGVGSIGKPTTVVYAPELSQLAILAAIRAGHVFIDVTGSSDGLLELTAQAGSEQAMMGDALHASTGTAVQFKLHVAHAAGATVSVLQDGKAVDLLKSANVETADQQFEFGWNSDGKPHWIRVDVRNAAGRLMLIGNPIYLNVKTE
ncbi:CehA/McbA family metallohydrolase [Undibacterium sp. TJN25]|uniref:CehA/McbA family metallohydrolase n=1 Tax=Undibacterium sp. TJN25 TaxID=3413056 RepID=UPI003BEF552C